MGRWEGRWRWRTSHQQRGKSHVVNVNTSFFFCFFFHPPVIIRTESADTYWKLRNKRFFRSAVLDLSAPVGLPGMLPLSCILPPEKLPEVESDGEERWCGDEGEYRAAILVVSLLTIIQSDKEKKRKEKKRLDCGKYLYSCFYTIIVLYKNNNNNNIDIAHTYLLSVSSAQCFIYYVFYTIVWHLLDK